MLQYMYFTCCTMVISHVVSSLDVLISFDVSPSSMLASDFVFNGVVSVAPSVDVFTSGDISVISVSFCNGSVTAASWPG